ncbi:MAG: 50S ribosomal protein L1 [Candidatus Buchananbacteria bacterium RIFCSPHIGHO2_02_FULL_45_11b]|uniref:Large ribosomal subunit protein uL1 n=3 Tax=Candidatus Buchananiibacteriota TaxID=1817903 RepID=A0A1G1YER2_9BACT|nr:MAG: 50S ribosomal protein L1 [Candidatus Buchananbacteria bacterium RIFCSPHIGHO2_01_FULL_46_12]OGY50741.1 MAG: 50S ribosomal protein L1 [Candidatus Buchananbacteria bacterium RIFCSPHIGHO2_02_FULL_45_11b]OGY55826.1 MAG: 50S ribosomal protein L1 [Candidatus Buchananbacteria bacterium RIFCSPLOWO2_02_FULL_46_11b]
MKHSKRYQEMTKKVEKNKVYPLAEAIKLAKETSTTKFDGSLEVHVRLGIDLKKTEQQVRGTIVLPFGTGKTKKIAAFVGPDKEKDAKEAGADLAGGQELIDQIKATGKVDFEIAVATPDLMPKMAAIAKILGPKGLMPSPKNETITTNLKKTIGELKGGKVNFKSDDTGNIHQIIGKTSFKEKDLENNYQAFLEAVKKVKPATAKGSYIQGVTIASSMGPGIKVQL